MAGMNPPMDRAASGRIRPSVANAPRFLMSWEDWLTLVAALIAFLSVAVSIDQAGYVRDMPAVVPTALCAVVIGMVAARMRIHPVLVHPAVLVVGLAVVVLMVQQYAEGASIFDRIADVRLRMADWWDVVLAGDISNDNLPFIALVHGVTFLATYLATYAIYRWHNPWLAILPGGIVLLANIGLAGAQQTAAIVFFLFGSILLIARLHLQRNQDRWRRQNVEYPWFISLSAGQLTLFLAIGLLFTAWLIPIGNQSTALEGAWSTVTKPFSGSTDTFARLFHNIDARRGTRLHTFGPFLAIQGDVSLGTRQLYEVKSGTGGLIRGTSYDEYTGNGWRVSERDETRVEGGELAASPEAAEYLERDIAILQVTVTDTDGTVLTSGVPIASNLDVVSETPPGYAGDIEKLTTRRGLGEGDTYTSLGSVSTASEEQLASAGAEYPAWVSGRYLQLPGDLPDRIQAEAQRVASEAGATTPYAAAVAIEDYLRGLPFDLAVPTAPPGQDIVDFLLFELKRGYFDYQSSAMAVMLRSLGVPSRIAVGYVLDPDEMSETAYVVRKDDAYAWVEVFFPAYGWVAFNPTGDRPEGGATGTIQTGTTPSDATLEPDLTLEDLYGGFFPSDLDGTLPDPIEALQEEPIVHSDPPWTLIWSLVGAAGAIVVVGLAGRVAWNWGLGGLEGPSRYWAHVHRIAGWARLPAGRAETPREWSRRLGHAIHRPHESSRLAHAYEEARYGRPDSRQTDPATTEDSYTQVRNGLLKSIFSRRLGGRPRLPRRHR